MSTQTQINSRMSAVDISLLLILSVLWGGSFFFFELLLEQWKPFTIVALRVGIASIVLWTILLARNTTLPKTGKAWIALIVVAILNNAVPFSLIVWGQTQITGGLSSILNATTPFFTILVAGALLADERMSRDKLIGVALGVFGIVVMIGPDVLLGGLRSGSVLGQFAVVMAAISYAFAGVWSRQFKSMGITPLVIAAAQTFFATLMLLPAAIYFESPIVDLVSAGADTWLTMACLAVFSTALAYLIYFKLIHSAGATNASLVTFLIPISAILLGIIFLSEPFTVPQAIGMVLIGLGLLIIDGRLLKRSS